MSGGVYGGDEVSAVVVDVGSCTLRAGFAGEDCPKVDIPTYCGVLEDAAAASADNKKQFFVGVSEMRLPRRHVEVVHPLKDGMIEDWDVMEGMLSSVFQQQLRADPAQHPLLMSEPSWNSKAKREKLCELVFEQFNAPAFFLVKNAVLTAFSHGKSTALVVDSGASGTSAVPVADGYVLSQAVIRTPLGGDLMARLCGQVLEGSGVGEVVAAYRVASKQPVEEREPAQWTERPGLPPLTESFRRFGVRDLQQDMAASCLQVSDEPFNQTAADSMPTVGYELPNGFNLEVGAERFRIPEALFDPGAYLRELQASAAPGAGANSMLSVPHCVKTAVERCDVDLRPAMFGNVLLAGGNSLLAGFSDRLQRDLAQRTSPNLRLKVIGTGAAAAGSSSERRFSSWVGGSILASLGTFQQMWISRAEYEESGKNIVEKKCP